MTQNGLISRLPKIPLNGPGRVKLKFVKMLGPKFGFIFEGLLAVQYFYEQSFVSWILQRPFFIEVGKENCLFGTPRKDHCSIIYNLISIHSGNWVGTPIVGFGKGFVYLKLD